MTDNNNTVRPNLSSEVLLNLRSRYRNTRVKKESDTGTIFFSIWRMPPILETRDPKRHKIAPDELHRPDLIAFREYGDASLFWAIAVRNNLMFPLIDIKTLAETESILLIPHIDDVVAALQRSSPNSPGTKR